MQLRKIAKTAFLLLRNEQKSLSLDLNAAFTLNGFYDHERNLTFVKTDFQVLKLKFYACNFKQAIYSLPKLKLYIK